MQPIADGIKIIIKESIIPKESHKLLYIIAPLVGIIIGLLVYNIIPIKNIISNNNH